MKFTNILSALTSAIFDADSYKVCHWDQYPPGTEYVSSYIEARKSDFAEKLGEQYNFVEFFGMQAFIKNHLLKPINQDQIDLAEFMFAEHGEPFNKKGWQHILDKHNGYLPIEIRAIPEGTVVPVGTALVEVVNTDPEAYWLPSYVETALQRAVWFPTTVATKSRIIKEICREFLDRTSDDPSGLEFMLHDFGARGVSSAESSALAGMAHIVNFKGTDTVMGIMGSLALYDPNYDKFLEETPDRPEFAMLQLLKQRKAEGKPFPAYSVEASEHSTMTIKGEEGEVEQIKMLIDKAKNGKGKIVSIVSDSYDYFRNVTEVYGKKFKQDILDAGKNGSRIVIRPDSGDPVEVVVKTLQLLSKSFEEECKINSRGKIVLPPCIRVLQGDGIDHMSLRNILQAVEKAGFSVENVVFGMGGGLEQKVNRDDLYFAQKTNAAQIFKKWVNIIKKPKTASSKISKTGRLSTIWNGVAFVTKKTAELVAGKEEDRMVPVYRDGKLLVNESFETIRERAEYFMSLWRNKPVQPIADPWAEAVKKPAAQPGA